jgi:hypothetical protein
MKPPNREEVPPKKSIWERIRKFMECKHEKWTVRESTEYDRTVYPPKLVTRKLKVCDNCAQYLGELPTRLNVSFRGSGTNDRRYLRGETERPD